MRSGSGTTVRRRSSVKVSTIVQYVALIALAVASFALIALMVVLSLRPGLAIYVNFWKLPIPPYFGNFTTALASLLPAMGRTLMISAASIGLLLIISTVASYSFARLRFPGRDVIFYGILAVMTVPAVITLSPNFILADQLNLLGSLWGLIVFYVAGGLPFAIFLITTFFRNQPLEIFEAARVDGASELRIMWRIAVPLAMPILVTVAILNFLNFYGDYIWPSLVLTEANQTLLLALQQFNPSVGQFGNRPDYGVQTAGYIVATIPQLLVFAFGMKYFVAGVTSGAIKA